MFPLKSMPEPRHPLHTQEWVDMVEQHYPGGYKQQFYRRQGKSTAQALAMLARAIEEPYKEFYIMDHYGTPEANRHLAELLRRCIDKLELQHMRVYQDKGRLCLMFGEKK